MMPTPYRNAPWPMKLPLKAVLAVQFAMSLLLAVAQFWPIAYVAVPLCVAPTFTTLQRRAAPDVDDWIVAARCGIVCTLFGCLCLAILRIAMVMNYLPDLNPNLLELRWFCLFAIGHTATGLSFLVDAIVRRTTTRASKWSRACGE
jgi:hypothetical protein